MNKEKTFIVFCLILSLFLIDFVCAGCYTEKAFTEITGDEPWLDEDAAVAISSLVFTNVDTYAWVFDFPEDPEQPSRHKYYKISDGENYGFSKIFTGYWGGDSGIYIYPGYTAKLFYPDYNYNDCEDEFDSPDILDNAHSIPIMGPKYITTSYRWEITNGYPPGSPDHSYFATGTYFANSDYPVNSLGHIGVLIYKNSPPIDLSINYVKPIQVIEDADRDGDGNVDLIAGKPVMVRVNVGLEGEESQEGVSVKLEIFEEGALSSVWEDTIDNFVVYQTYEDKPEYKKLGKDTVNFFVTKKNGWIPSYGKVYTFNVTVDPGNDIFETDEAVSPHGC